MVKKHLPEGQHMSASFSEAEAKIQASYEKMREPVPLAPKAFMQVSAQMYRHPVHSASTTRLLTLPLPNAIPCKRSYDDAEALSNHLPSASQDVRKPQSTATHLFHLPRELRDLIYGCCKDHSRPNTKAITSEYSGTTFAIIRDAPWLALTRCNKKLSQEYRETFWETTTLVLIDYFDANNGLSTPPLQPHLFQNLTQLDSVLLAICETCEHSAPHSHRCGVYDELQSHRAWLGKLVAQIPNLKTLTIKLFVQWPRENPSEILRYPRSPHKTFDLHDQLSVLMELKALKSIEVHRHRTMAAGDGLDARQPEAEVFDLYLKAFPGSDNWYHTSEERGCIEREWWQARQWKGVEAWKEGEKEVPALRL